MFINTFTNGKVVQYPRYWIIIKSLIIIKQRVCESVCLCTNSRLNGKFYRYRIWYFNTPGVKHELIIKWTQQIGFLALAGIAPVVEGNYGNDSKER